MKDMNVVYLNLPEEYPRSVRVLIQRIHEVDDDVGHSSHKTCCFSLKKNF
jgi:hypothetical protein